tara:strand:+ start:49 stop:378 length:330 start_codon:yes stop_codon:yes gene_type:complete
MKRTKENFLIYSIVILIFGWLYFFTIDYFNYLDFMEQFKDGLLINLPRSGKYDTIWYKLIAIGFGLISLYFSYKSKPLKKSNLIILVSLFLIIMSFIYFPHLIFEIAIL